MTAAPATTDPPNGPSPTPRSERSRHDWRGEATKYVGPGLLAGIMFGDWVKLLAANGFRVPPSRWAKAGTTTTISLAGTAFKRLERAIYGRKVDAAAVAPPVFLLGHYRSGTTHLQNLFATDRRFGHPTFAHVMLPHTFLVSEPLMNAIGGAVVPRTRMGVDDVPLGPRVPFEEEYALAVMTFRSPYLGWAFPERADDYDRFLTFRDASADDVAVWKDAFRLFAKKLTVRYGGRPLVFKSPPHTGRIRLLLELFPDAKFVHIRRDPYTVYRSTVRLHEKTAEPFAFQRLDPAPLHGRVVRQYRELYDAYFEERSLIPPGRLVEIAYEDLDREPLAQLEKVYSALGLPDFAEARPAAEAYLRSLAGYTKNRHPDLPPAVRDELRREWRRSFEEWGYPT